MSLDNTYEKIKILKTKEPLKSDFSYKDVVKKEDLQNFYKKIKHIFSLFERFFDSKTHKTDKVVYLKNRIQINKTLKVEENFIASSLEIGENSLQELNKRESKISFSPSSSSSNKSFLRYKTKNGKIMEIKTSEQNESLENKDVNFFFDTFKLFDIVKIKNEKQEKEIIEFTKTFRFGDFNFNNLYCKSATAKNPDSGLFKGVKNIEGNEESHVFEIKSIDERANITHEYKIKGYRGVIHNVERT